MSPSRGTEFRWVVPPGNMGREFHARMMRARPLLMALAATHAARGESTMKGGAAWMDQTGHARASLYGRAEGLDIVLGTSNSEYGIFLELGTVKMAARPIIQPTLDSTAQAYFDDAARLVGGLFGG